MHFDPLENLQGRSKMRCFPNLIFDLTVQTSVEICVVNFPPASNCFRDWSKSVTFRDKYKSIFLQQSCSDSVSLAETRWRSSGLFLSRVSCIFHLRHIGQPGTRADGVEDKWVWDAKFQGSALHNKWAVFAVYGGAVKTFTTCGAAWTVSSVWGWSGKRPFVPPMVLCVRPEVGHC